METEGKKILVNYLTDIADTFRSITGETDTISAENFSKEVQAVAAPSSKNSYQRNSIEEMNAITDAKDGDTCLCYYTNSFNITEDRAVGVITFPKKVVFKNAITEYYNAEIRAVDSSIELFGMIDLSPNDFNFRVDKMDDQSRANVFYSSEDGITYILEPPLDVEGSFELVDERTIDFKININIQNTNEYIGAFLVGINQVFDGLYKYYGNWKTLGLNYPLDRYNVEISKKYYNNGEQEGLLGATGTLQGVQKLNDFIKKYGTDFVYPEDMSNCFLGYEGERIPLLELNPNTSNVTNMNSMFFNCENLISILPIDTSNVIGMNHMFYGCKSLTTIPQLDLSKAYMMLNMFYPCSALTTLGGFQNLGMAYDTDKDANFSYYTLDLSTSPKLTHDSLMNVINGLYDIKTKGCNPQQLILGSTNLEKLTAEEIAIATNKGWNVK